MAAAASFRGGTWRPSKTLKSYDRYSLVRYSTRGVFFDLTLTLMILSSRHELSTHRCSAKTLGFRREVLESQLMETKALLRHTKSKIRMSRDRQQPEDDDRGSNDNYDGVKDVNNVLNVTTVNGMPLTRYNRSPSKHKINTTKVLNTSFLKQVSEPSVVPRGSDIMRIRNDETLRNIGRLPYHEMILHSPSVMAEKHRAETIIQEEAGKRTDRIIFQSGSGFVYKRLPAKR